MANRDLSSDEPKMWSSRYAIGAAALIVVALLVAYAPAIRGDFIWDDPVHVTTPELRSAHGLYRIWIDVKATPQYYPLLNTVFWIEHKLWGDQPVGYHLANIAQHALNAVMVLMILRGLLISRGVSWADTAACLTAAVFALHPVHVESVAWISEQKNTLSAVFFLAALAFYLRFDRSRQTGLYLWATALFVCGLLTKSVTATLPAVILVIFWWQRGKLSLKRDVAPLLPWFVIGALSGLFTAWVERDLLGAKGEAFDLSGVQRVMLSGQVVWFYLYKLVWPAELIFIYPRWRVDPAVLWQWVFTSALIALLIVLFAFSRRSRAPLAGILYFTISLFPVMGFFNVYFFVYSLVADHFQYLASLGVIALVCGGIAAVLSQVPWLGARVIPSLAIAAILGALTFRQCQLYSGNESIYQATLQLNPDCWIAHNNLGLALEDRGRRQDAIEHYRTAASLRPDYAAAHNNLGAALSRMGQYESAIAAHREALRFAPDFPEAHFNLGMALAKTGNIKEAVAEFEITVRIRPNFVEARKSLALTYGSTGRFSDAIESLREALRLDPANAGLHRDLGVNLQAAGRPADALVEFHRALELAPDMPGIRTPLTLAEAATQSPEKAIGLFEQVLHAEPGNVQAQFGLAVALTQTGRAGEAIAHYEIVLKANPNHVEAHSNLATLLAKSSRLPEAIPHFEKALQLKPDRVEMHMNLAVAYSSAGRFPDALAAAQHARELAHRSGQMDLVQRIDTWIETCRARAGTDVRTQPPI